MKVCVLPKFRQHAKYFQDFTPLVCTLLSLKSRKREWDNTKNNVLSTSSYMMSTLYKR